MYQQKNKKKERKKKKEINLRFVGKTGNFGAFFSANGSVVRAIMKKTTQLAFTSV